MSTDAETSSDLMKGFLLKVLPPLLAVAVMGVLLLALWSSTPTVYFDSGTEEATGCQTSTTDGLVVGIEDPRCQEVLESGRYEVVWEAPKWMRDEARGVRSDDEE